MSILHNLLRIIVASLSFALCYGTYNEYPIELQLQLMWRDYRMFVFVQKTKF